MVMVLGTLMPKSFARPRTMAFSPAGATGVAGVGAGAADVRGVFFDALLRTALQHVTELQITLCGKWQVKLTAWA